MKQYKNLFPIYEKQKELVYLDSGATALKPKMVLEKMMEYYEEYSANIHRGVYKISEEATEEYEEAREKVARFIGAESKEVIFASGTTESINMAARMIEAKSQKSKVESQKIKAGDEIVVTEMEHHSNLVPWQELCKRTGAKLKYIPVNRDNFKLEIKDLGKIINRKTKVLAITQVSNVLGTVNPVKEIIKKAKEINPEIITVVDGAQAVAHMNVDVRELGCDFYAFSGHKMYGPTGIGVLWGKKEMLEKMEPVVFGGGMIWVVGREGSNWAPMPDCFEAGTPKIGEAIGLGAAVDFICGIGWKEIIEQENCSKEYALKRLKEIEGLKLFANGEAGVSSFVLPGAHAHDVASILDSENVCVRAGYHCAMPLHEILGEEATVRVSLGIYNDKEDIDKLVEGIMKVKKIFNV